MSPNGRTSRGSVRTQCRELHSGLSLILQKKAEISATPMGVHQRCSPVALKLRGASDTLVRPLTSVEASPQLDVPQVLRCCHRGSQGLPSTEQTPASHSGAPLLCANSGQPLIILFMGPSSLPILPSPWRTPVFQIKLF